MTLSLELPSRLFERLKAEAEVRGTSPEQIVRDVLETRLPAPAGGKARDYDPHDVTSRRPETKEELLQEFDEFLRLTEDLPAANIPDEMLSREHMYEDRHV